MTRIYVMESDRCADCGVIVGSHLRYRTTIRLYDPRYHKWHDSFERKNTRCDACEAMRLLGKMDEGEEDW